MVSKKTEWFRELKNVQTIGLISTSTNVLERIIWATLGIIGIAWAFYFVPQNYKVWENNPSIITQANMDLSQIQYPAISIATSGTPKYAIAERLGNFVDPNKLPKNFKKMRVLLLECTLFKEKNQKKDRDYYNAYQNECIFSFSLMPSEKSACKVNHNVD